MSEFGTVKICRGIFTHEAFKPERFTQREAFVWMVFTAVKNSGPRNWNGHVVKLKRGQFVHSQRFMERRFKWTRHEVRSFCEHLVGLKMIEKTVAECGVTCVTVLNYEKWQSMTPYVADYVTEFQPAHDQQETAASRGKVNEKDGPPQAAPPVSRPATAQISENLTDSVVDVGVARARESYSISPEAFALADELMVLLGIDLKFVPPPWMGFANWVQTGLASGWQPPLVRIAVARIRARKKYEVPFSFRYLAKPIQREHQLAAEPHLPIPPVTVSNNGDVFRGPHPSAKSGIAAIDRVFDRVSTLRSGNDQSADENPVRSLSPRSISGR